jgi:hypothetical protein
MSEDDAVAIDLARLGPYVALTRHRVSQSCAVAALRR